MHSNELKGIFTLDKLLIVQSWNQWLEKATGITSDRACGSHLRDLIPDISSRGWLRIITQFISSTEAGFVSVERQYLPESIDTLTTVINVGSPQFAHLFDVLPLSNLGSGLIPCPPTNPSTKFPQMQQRVTIELAHDTQLDADADAAARWAIDETPDIPLPNYPKLKVTIEDITPELETGSPSPIPEGELAALLASDDELTRLRGVQALVQSWGVAQGAAAGPSLDSTKSREKPETITYSSLLVSALGDESWRVRQAAVDGLARHSGDSLIPTLVRLIREQHEDLSVLNSTLSVLALSNLDTIAPLSALLRDKTDPNLRIYVAQVLGELHNPQAIPALMEALKDPDVNLCYHAIEALGNLRATEAVEVLAEIAESRDFFLAFPALAALMRIGEPTVAPRLVPLMQDELLCEPAAGALGLLGGKEVVKPLASLLNLPDVPSSGIARALATLYARYEQVYGEGMQIALEASAAITPAAHNNLVGALPIANAEELGALVLVLSWLEGDLIERALVGLLDSGTVGEMAADALTRYGSRATELLIAQLNPDNLEASRRAVVALGRIGDTRAVPSLTAMLRYASGLPADMSAKTSASASLLPPNTSANERAKQTDEASRLAAIAERVAKVPHSPELTIACAEALARIGVRESSSEQSHQAMEALIELLGNEDAGVRQAAIAALDSLGHPEMPAYLIGGLATATGGVTPSLLKNPNPYVRESAVKIAGYFGFPECVPYLLSACADPEERVRRAAIEILPYLDMDERVLPLLAAALSSDQPNVRAAAARAMEMLEIEGAYHELLRALGDKDVWVRYYAVRSLGRMGRKEALPFLSQLVQDSQEAPQVRVAAVKALGNIDGAEAVKVLEALLFGAEEDTVASSGETDPDLVLAAIAALGQIQSPEALPPLLRLLQSPEPQRRVDALRALGDTRSQGVAEAIYAIAVSDDDPQAVRSAIYALAHLAATVPSQSTWAGGAEAMLALIELMGDPEKVETCITAMTGTDAANRISSDEQIKWLATGLNHELPAVRRGVVEVLTRLKKPAASQRVIAALADTDPGVRLAAVRCLGHLGNRDCLGVVADLARSDPDPAVRRAAQKMLQM